MKLSFLKAELDDQLFQSQHWINCGILSSLSYCHDSFQESGGNEEFISDVVISRSYT